MADIISKKRIHSISGLKTVFLLLIILSHYGIPLFNLNVARRGVEFFFVTSGFLAYYSHKDSGENLWKATSEIIRKKLVLFLPLHLLTFVYWSIVSRPTVKTALLNLFLLHAWSNDSNIYFSLNGPLWYISALVFCFALFPASYRLIKKAPVSCSFTVIFVLRFLLEALSAYLKVLPISIHTFPVVRLFDFLLGSCTARLFLEHNKLSSSKKAVVSIAEVLLLLSLFLVDNYWGTVIPRSCFVLFICCLLYVFAFDSGVISKILSVKPLAVLSNIQFELYTLHSPVSSFINFVFILFIPDSNNVIYLRQLIALVVLFVASFVYSSYLRSPIQQIFKKAFKLN